MSKSYKEITDEEINQLNTLLENAKNENLNEIEFLGQTLSIDYGFLLLIACTELNEKDKSSNS
jgi:hypothetical protein